MHEPNDSTTEPVNDNELEKKQPLENALDKRTRENDGKKRDWLTSPLLLALVALLGTGIGASLQGYWNTQLERQKFESGLIQKALESPSKEQAANNLKFLLDAGLIQSLDKTKIAELAKSPANLPFTIDGSGHFGCVPAPLVATLNYWPITYAPEAELCHDFPAVDVRSMDGHYSYSEKEWEAGRTARAGEELFVSVWIHNGAADQSGSVARNVKLSIHVDTEASAVHYIDVQFSGEGTNTVRTKFKISTPDNDRLSVSSDSGAIFDFTGEKMLRDRLQIGNGTFLIGDFKPSFSDGRFVRFKLTVIH